MSENALQMIFSNHVEKYDIEVTNFLLQWIPAVTRPHIAHKHYPQVNSVTQHNH